MLRQNGFAVRVADPGDTVAVRLGAGPGLVGLVVSADVDDMRDKGVVIWALFTRSQDAQGYYQALQVLGDLYASTMNEAYPPSTVGGRSFILYSCGRGVQAYLPIATVPHVSTADVRPYSLSRRNLWRQAERALIRSVGVG